MSEDDARPRGRAPRWLGAIVVLGVCAIVYWSWLGASGFQGTEGHRVIPGWTMLERGEWMRVAMFEQTYLRKPPGMPWAIGASAAAFGESEWSARAVSAAAATASALVAMAFAGRWFGRRYGVYAGLCQALTPLFWQPGRTADIEALHNLGVQVAAFALVDAIAGRRRESRESARQIALGLLAGAGVIVAALAKGPAGAPVLVGIIVGVLVVHRRIGAVTRPAAAIAALAGAGVLVPLGMAILKANADPGAVREDVSGFLWSWSTLLRTVRLPAEAFIAALPAAAWALFPFGPDARREAAQAGATGEARLCIARVLAWSWLGSLGVCVFAGLSNPRYAMPGAMLLAPLAAYVAHGAAAGLTPSRRFIAQAICLGRPLVLGLLLTGGAFFLALRESNWDPDRSGGPDAGAVIANLLPASVEPIELWADGLVEARPDVLLYAARAAIARDVPLRPLWRKASVQRGELPPPGALLALRTDARGDERPAYASAIADGRLRPLGGGAVHKFEFSAFRVESPR